MAIASPCTRPIVPDRLRVARGNRLQAVRDLVERLLPRDAFELAFSLFADAAHRVQQAVGVVRAFDVARDLRAQHAGRRRMIRIALDLRGHAVLHGHEQRAGIGAVMRAGAADDGLGHRIHPGKRR